MTDKNKFRLYLIGFVLLMAFALIFWPTGDPDPDNGTNPASSGCTDSKATNYDSKATSNDGSCIYLDFNDITPEIKEFNADKQIWEISNVWGGNNAVKFSQVYIVFSDGSKSLIRNDGKVYSQSVCGVDKLEYSIAGNKYYSGDVTLPNPCEFKTPYNPAKTDLDFINFVENPMESEFSFSTLSNWSFYCIENVDTLPKKNPFEMRLYLQISNLMNKSFSVLPDNTDVDKQILYLKCDTCD